MSAVLAMGSARAATRRRAAVLTGTPIAVPLLRGAWARAMRAASHSDAARLTTLTLALVLVACGGSGTAPDDGGTDRTDGGTDGDTTDARGGADTGGTDAGYSDAPGGDAQCTTDDDGDGHVSIACGGDDCVDTNRAFHPSAPGTCGLCPSPSMGSETCNGLDDDCSGTIDDEPSASASCVLAHGTPICTTSACAMASCDAGYHGCSGACVSNASPATCGASCAPCARPAGAIATCDGTICAFVCDATDHLCAGACASNASPATCGAGCTPCVPPPRSSATCDGTICGFSCDAGYAAVGGACDIAPPRPIAPLSTATVTSQQPTMQWSLAAGTDGARVEICRDRACTMPLATLDVTGTSATVASPLPAGVLFWRLSGRVGSTTSGVTSPTWEFTVGARSASWSTSWGTTLDVNGDGHADVLIGAPAVSAFTGRVYVYLGGATDLVTVPAVAITGSDPGGAFGSSVASAGDVNGDGYSDVVVGAPNASSRTGRVYVFLGGATGLGGLPATTLTGPDLSGQFGRSVASAGDVNGDGYADVVVGAPDASSATGSAYVYLGSASGLGTAPATTLAGPDGTGGYFGGSVASGGDVNGDGYGDIVVGADGASSRAGRVYVYVGGASGLGTAPATTLTGPDTSGAFGNSVAGAGDVDGDGFADVVIGANEASGRTGRAYVYVGGASGLGTAPATTLTGPDGVSSEFGLAVASAGDVNADGYADIVVGAFNRRTYFGRARVYVGGATGLGIAPAATLLGYAGWFSHAVASAGDVNGDGYGDVLVGSELTMNGTVYVYLGYAGGLNPFAAVTLNGPDASSWFGAAVASAEDANMLGVQTARAAK